MFSRQVDTTFVNRKLNSPNPLEIAEGVAHLQPFLSSTGGEKVFAQSIDLLLTAAASLSKDVAPYKEIAGMFIQFPKTAVPLLIREALSDEKPNKAFVATAFLIATLHAKTINNIDLRTR